MTPPRNVVVKVTNGCNLACRYCYAGPTGSTRITDEILLSTTQQFADTGAGTTHFIWHGGEPWNVGMEFYERALYYQYWNTKRTGHRFVNSIQTNGTLVTEEITEFCRRHSISMGFSLDGPCDVQGTMRPFSNGANSFDAVFRGMQFARDHNIGGTGAIVVLNSFTRMHLERIYNFFKTQHFSMKINPLIRAGRAELRPDLGITPDDYADTMIPLFDRYVTECPDIRIDPFDMLLGNVALGENKGVCIFNTNCQHNFMSVTQDGDAYPCARFDGDPAMRYGNILTDGLPAILRSVLRTRLLTRNAQLDPICSRCGYLKCCYGGCMNNGYMRRHNPLDRDYYCTGYRKLYDHINAFIGTQTEPFLNS